MKKEVAQFRRTQVSQPPAGRKFAKAKTQKLSFDIFVTDIETGVDARAAMTFAKKRFVNSRLASKIEFAAFTAVPVRR